MLQESRGLVACVYVGANQYHGNLASAVRAIALPAFVKDDYQQPVLLETSVRNQRGNIGLKPVIGRTQLLRSSAIRRRRTVVSVVAIVGNDERETRPMVVGEIPRKLTEWHHVYLLHSAVSDVGDISKRIVVLNVGIPVTTDISSVGQALCVCLPGHTRAQ